MTGAEYRTVRDRLGWSQARLARELGVDVMTVSRRERNETPIDSEAEHAIMRMVEREGRSEAMAS